MAIVIFARCRLDHHRGQLVVFVPVWQARGWVFGCTVRPWRGIPGRPQAIRFPLAWFWGTWDPYVATCTDCGDHDECSLCAGCLKPFCGGCLEPCEACGDWLCCRCALCSGKCKAVTR